MKKGKKITPKKQEKETQLDLGIKEPFKNKFFKLKGKTDKIVRRMEVRKYLSDPLTWAVIIISIVMIATQVYKIYNSLHHLPSLLPILQYQIQNTNKLISKWYILIFPITSFIVLVFTIFATSKFYSREKYLSKILLVTAFMNTFSQTIILIDLINRF